LATYGQHSDNQHEGHDDERDDHEHLGGRMTLRTGHGRGAGSPRIEVLPPDELPPASSANTGRRERGPDGKFLPGNTVARSRRLRPGPRGLVGVDQTSDEFRPFARWGARYGAHRRRELASSHGGEISAGVGAIIESAAQAMAASRYLQTLASQKNDPELFKQASQLASTARQHELAAWELAARECQARPKKANPTLTAIDQAARKRLDATKGAT